MPNQSQQLPNIDLPGAEYFALAPNRTVALNGRRRAQLLLPSVTVPGNTAGHIQGSIVIENPFPQTSGIYLHDARLVFIPADASSELQIVASRLGFGINPSAPPGNIDVLYDAGLPIATTLAPAGAQVIIADRDKLITQIDIANSYAPPAPAPGVLTLSCFVWVKNIDATNPHSMVAFAPIVYTRLDGFNE